MKPQTEKLIEGLTKPDREIPETFWIDVSDLPQILEAETGGLREEVERLKQESLDKWLAYNHNMFDYYVIEIYKRIRPVTSHIDMTETMLQAITEAKQLMELME